MKLRLLLVVLSMACACSGCRRDPSMYIEVLNAQKRALEDELYELEYDYELALDELDECRAQLAAAELDAGPTPARRSPLNPPRTPAIPDLEPPVIEEGVPGLPGVDIDLGEEELDTGALLPQPQPTPAKQPGAIASSSTSDGVDQPGSRRGTARLVIDPVQTGGADFDGRPGDDGLVIVVRPEGGDLPTPTGPERIAVVVLDPVKEGDDARVARWDITAQQIANYRQQTAQGPAYRLKLPWPEHPPSHSRLHLFIRYLSEDGGQLEADQEIDVTLPGQAISSWTPRSTPIDESAADVARRQTSYGQTRLGTPQPVEPQRSPSAPPTPAWSPHR